jgi:DNA-binding NtrC family response regulator
VLILGERGSGKEHVADAIHRYSGRTGKFLAVNCTAIPPELFESELFGTVRGAFSGAVKKRGQIEEADNGTLFLDEIGDMPLEIQSKLHRFLETGVYFQLGSTKEISPNVRVVSATNRNLQKRIHNGSFRADLLDRINILEIHLPPLRERKDDIPVLTLYFAEKFAAEYNLPIPRFSRSALDLMRSHPWPGNVRELKKVVIKTLLDAKRPEIGPEDLSIPKGDNSISVSKNRFPLLSEILSEVEKTHIQRAVAETAGNKTKAAQLLGISREALRYKMKDYRLTPP